MGPSRVFKRRNYLDSNQILLGELRGRSTLREANVYVDALEERRLPSINASNKAQGLWNSHERTG